MSVAEHSACGATGHVGGRRLTSPAAGSPLLRTLATAAIAPGEATHAGHPVVPEPEPEPDRAAVDDATTVRLPGSVISCERCSSCRCRECAAAYARAPAALLPSDDASQRRINVLHDVSKDGWLVAQLAAMEHPCASCVIGAIPAAELLSELLDLCAQPSGLDAIRTTLRAGALEPLLRLCVGRSDYLRWKGLQLLAALAGHDLGDALHIRELSDKTHAEVCDLHRCARQLYEHHLTPATQLVPLDETQLRAILAGCRVACREYHAHVDKCEKRETTNQLPADWLVVVQSHLSVEDATALRTVASRIATAAACFPTPSDGAFAAFVKLSSRSPKDSLLAPHRERTLRRAGASVDGAELNSLRPRDAADAMGLLLLSNRVQSDLESHLDAMEAVGFNSGSTASLSDISDAADASTKTNMYICCREWLILDHAAELRCFVSGLQLTAVSQYFDDRRSRWSDDPSGALAAATECFTELRPILVDLGIVHCIFDLGVVAQPGGDLEKLVVIELNSFGMRTGSALFDWDDPSDLNILIGVDEHLPTTVRVVTDNREPRGACSVLARTQKLCRCDG